MDFGEYTRDIIKYFIVTTFCVVIVLYVDKNTSSTKYYDTKYYMTCFLKNADGTAYEAMLKSRMYRII